MTDTPKAEEQDWLDEVLEKVFTFGVGTQSDDIKGNDKAYLNLKMYATSEAKASILSHYKSLMEEELRAIPLDFENSALDATEIYVSERLAQLLGDKK